MDRSDPPAPAPDDAPRTMHELVDQERRAQAATRRRRARSLVAQAIESRSLGDVLQRAAEVGDPVTIGLLDGHDEVGVVVSAHASLVVLADVRGDRWRALRPAALGWVAARPARDPSGTVSRPTLLDESVQSFSDLLDLLVEERIDVQVGIGPRWLRGRVLAVGVALITIATEGGEVQLALDAVTAIEVGPGCPR